MGRWLVGVRRWKRDGGAHWIVGGLAAVVLLAAGGSVYALTGGDPATTEAASTSEVDRGEVSAAVATTGTLEPAETRSLGFAIAGTVTSVNVRAGDMVEAGQVLAEIDDTDATEAVDDAEEELAQASDALAEAEASTDEASEGGTTCPVASSARDADAFVLVAAPATGSPSPSPTPSPSSSPPPSPTPTPSPTPSTSPSPSTTTPKQPPPTTSAPSTGQAPSAPTAPGGGGGGQNCPGTEPQAGGASGGDAVFQAEQRVITAEQRLAEAEADLAGTRITAVIAGKVLTVGGEVGSEVSGGGTFITLADVVGMQVAASFPEADTAALVAGLPATVTLANHPGEQFPAVVVRVDPVGATDGTMVRYGAVLAFEEAPADLLVGQNAGVRVTTASVSDVLRVPVTSPRGDGTVLVDTPDGMVPRAVEVGLRGDQYIEIRSGLQEGDRVVVTGS